MLEQNFSATNSEHCVQTIDGTNSDIPNLEIIRSLLGIGTCEESSSKDDVEAQPSRSCHGFETTSFEYRVLSNPEEGEDYMEVQEESGSVVDSVTEESDADSFSDYEQDVENAQEEPEEAASTNTFDVDLLLDYAARFTQELRGMFRRNEGREDFCDIYERRTMSGKSGREMYLEDTLAVAKYGDKAESAVLNAEDSDEKVNDGGNSEYVTRVLCNSTDEWISTSCRPTGHADISSGLGPLENLFSIIHSSFKHNSYVRSVFSADRPISDSLKRDYDLHTFQIFSEHYEKSTPSAVTHNRKRRSDCENDEQEFGSSDALGNCYCSVNGIVDIRSSAYSCNFDLPSVFDGHPAQLPATLSQPMFSAEHSYDHQQSMWDPSSDLGTHHQRSELVMNQGTTSNCEPAQNTCFDGDAQDTNLLYLFPT